jgi:hypothetical protein
MVKTVRPLHAIRAKIRPPIYEAKTNSVCMFLRVALLTVLTMSTLCSHAKLPKVLKIS